MPHKCGSQDMSHFGTRAHRSRHIFTFNNDKCDLRIELVASKATWSHWFRCNKAFFTTIDNRTCVQVVSQKISPGTVSCLSKRVPIKLPICDKASLSSYNGNNKSMGHVHVKWPLHIKLSNVTEVLPLNTIFQVLTTHTDTSDAVLDDTIVNIPWHQEIRVYKQHMMDTKIYRYGYR